MMPGRQRAAQLERVDLRSRLVAGQEVVDRVKDAQALIIAPCALRGSGVRT
jgi:hypothetical protein